MIIPVKALSRAKTRLVSGESGSAPIAFAFFQDALAAVAASTGVRSTIVTTSDPVVAAWAIEQGAAVVDDSAADGINAAAAFAARASGLAGPVAVVVSDLPCLTPAAFDAVLALAARHHSSFVRDAVGSGTTMWLNTEGVVDSQFGLGSAAAHLAAGATDLVALADQSTLTVARRDVDTSDDLVAARALGVGHFTTSMVGSHVLVTVAEERLVAAVDAVPVVDDDGHWHQLPGELLATAGFRVLRVGQRLVVEFDPTGEATTARLP